jgi:regulator of sigma E protease
MTMPAIIAVYVIALLVGLTIVVFVHGLGHYLAARVSGVRAAVFSIGFGPAIVGWNDRAGTRWKVGVVPVGGYVTMAEDGTAPRPRFLRTAAVAIAGPLISIIFAIMLLSGVLTAVGESVTPTKIGIVVQDSPAAEAGLQPGDEILAVDGKPVESFEDVRRMVQVNTGTPLSLAVRRDDRPLTLTVTPRIVEEVNPFEPSRRVAMIGISPAGQPRYARRNPLTAVSLATDIIWRSVVQVVWGSRRQEMLVGPIGIVARQPSLTFAHVTEVSVLFVAQLSLLLGLINLLPLPFLDGGRLLLAVWRRWRQRQASNHIRSS